MSFAPQIDIATPWWAEKKEKNESKRYVPFIQFNGRHESCSLNSIAFTFVANTVTDRRPDKRHRTSRRGVFHSYERLFNRTFPEHAPRSQHEGDYARSNAWPHSDGCQSGDIGHSLCAEAECQQDTTQDEEPDFKARKILRPTAVCFEHRNSSKPNRRSDNGWQAAVHRDTEHVDYPRMIKLVQTYSRILEL
jgi:hypothetical protein